MTPLKAERTVKTYTMTVGALPADVFPLLCPVREYEWIKPWSCDMVFSVSGTAENNAVFRTNFPTQGGEETWIVCRYEKDRALEKMLEHYLKTGTMLKMADLGLEADPYGQDHSH